MSPVSKTLYILIFSATIFAIGTCKAQMVVEPSNSIVVLRQDGSQLMNPWTGGLNAAEISTFDADLDGENDDIYLFDKAGNRSLVFLGNIENGEQVYTHAPKLSVAFPFLHDWALMRDYDCDGRKDIFTYGSGSFAVFRNTSEPVGGLSFEMVSSSVQSYYQFNSNQYTTNIFVSSQDIPAIFDFEGDGDLDILTFSVTGTSVELHLNSSIENGQPCSLENFALRNRCYGRFVEGSETNQISIDPAVVNSSCGFNVVNPKDNSSVAKGPRHIGSTLLAFDASQDGLVDIVIGDVSYQNLTYLENSDRPGNMVDSVISVVTDFPANFNSNAVALNNFPAAFYEDIDKDGIRDLLVSVNNPYSAENRNSILYYRNTGADNLPNFSFVQDNFLQDQTIDFGETSAVAFFDYNNDNLQDLVVGSRGEFMGLSNFMPRLSLFINVGTITTPVYKLLEENWLDISSTELQQYPQPTFGDLDGDGDLDLILGHSGGELFLFTNTSDAGSNTSFVLLGNVMSSGEVLDVGQNTAPQLFDLDENGTLDLIIGERNGNLNYYSNTGTSTSAEFEFITDTLGGIDGLSPGFYVGNSIPHFYRFDGITRLALGGEDGHIHLYDAIDGNLSGDYSLVSSEAFGVNAGWRSTPYVIDLNNDNILDIVCGQIGGGLQLYMGVEPATYTENDRVADLSLRLSPNPASDQLRILNLTALSFHIPYIIHDLSGKVCQTGIVQSSEIFVGELSSGLYILTVLSKDSPFFGKFVKE